MKKPYLVLTTGFPSAGKSEISKYLQKELGFVRLSTDDIRKSYFDVDNYHTYKNDVLYQKKEFILTDTLNRSKLTSLYYGLDVVIDSSAGFEKIRDQFLDTKINENSMISADKFLIYLKVDEDILRERNKIKGRKNNPVKEWKEFWQDPIKSEDYKLITYENNVSIDLDKILQDIDKRFRRNNKNIFSHSDYNK